MRRKHKEDWVRNTRGEREGEGILRWKQGRDGKNEYIHKGQNEEKERKMKRKYSQDVDMVINNDF